MVTYERTESGFDRALRSVEWMSKMHNKDFALFVHKDDPHHYTTSIPDIIRKEHVSEGTNVLLVHPDGSSESMFDAS